MCVAYETRYTPEKCTGLYDESGKLIFEGDVLWGDFPQFPKTVVWKSGGFYFVNRSGSTVPVTEEYTKTLKLKVCGNIHEVDK